MKTPRPLVALTLACSLTACAGGGDSSRADSTAASAAPTEASSADDATADACTETGLALAPLADGLAGGDLEGALANAEVPAWEPSGTTPTVELALGRMELELSFAKQAVELGVFGTDGRSDLQKAYDNLDEACAGAGSGF